MKPEGKRDLSLTSEQRELARFLKKSYGFSWPFAAHIAKDVLARLAPTLAEERSSSRDHAPTTCAAPSGLPDGRCRPDCAPFCLCNLRLMRQGFSAEQVAVDGSRDELLSSAPSPADAAAALSALMANGLVLSPEDAATAKAEESTVEAPEWLHELEALARYASENHLSVGESKGRREEFNRKCGPGTVLALIEVVRAAASAQARP